MPGLIKPVGLWWMAYSLLEEVAEMLSFHESEPHGDLLYAIIGELQVPARTHDDLFHDDRLCGYTHHTFDKLVQVFWGDVHHVSVLGNLVPGMKMF